jgi:hypothetical protein
MFNNNRKTVLIAATVAALFIFVGNLIFNGGNVLIAGISALLGIPFFLLANAGFARYRASLSTRAATPATDTPGVVWDVYMNGVIVGSLPDHTLAALQGEVANDWRNMGAQALNVLQVPLRLVDKFLVAIPAIAFWLILACALFAPNDLIQTFTAVRDASPREIHQGVATAVSIFFTVGLIAFMLNWMLTGYTFGLRNVYRERFVHVLRRYLKVAATGELVISRLADGTSYHYDPDMFGWLRAGSRARRPAQEHKA